MVERQSFRYLLLLIYFLYRQKMNCLVYIALLSLAINVYAKKDCPENEEIKSSEVDVSSKACLACEPTCANQNPLCEGICAPPDKCFCKNGFVRNEKGKCVKPSECGNVIRVTRDSITRYLKKRQAVVGVNPGGVGAAYPGGGVYGRLGVGYGNNAMNQGVGFGVNGEPPAACAGNEVWHQCGLACIQTCANPAPICPSQCAPSQAGCTCTLGNVRDLASGQCYPQGTYCSGVNVNDVNNINGK